MDQAAPSPRLSFHPVVPSVDRPRSPSRMMESHRRALRFYAAVLWIVFFTLQAGDLGAQTDFSPVRKNRFGLSAAIGNTYNPVNDIGFLLLNGFVLFDRERLCGYRIPECLRLKVEGNIGSTITPYKKIMASTNLLVLIYFTESSLKTFRPYVEGGIGAIYTDFQVEGEGLRFNFEPLFGIGTEIKTASGAVYLISSRIQHFSNGSLNRNNVGVDSLCLLFGKIF